MYHTTLSIPLCVGKDQVFQNNLFIPYAYKLKIMSSPIYYVCMRLCMDELEEAHVRLFRFSSPIFFCKITSLTSARMRGRIIVVILSVCLSRSDFEVLR